MSKKFLTSIFILLLLFLGGVFLYINGEEFFNKIKSEISKSGFLKAQLTIEKPLPQKMEMTGNSLGNESFQEEGKETYFEADEIAGEKAESAIDSVQEDVDDVSEKIDILNQETAELMGLKRENISKEDLKVEEEEKSAKQEEDREKEEDLDKEIDEEESEKQLEQETEQIVCDKITFNLSLKKEVIFNEIAWMGTVNSSSDEWIELKNISGEIINLAGWQILDKEDQIKIIFKEKLILPGEFILLERTNDDSVKGIEADLIYSGGLNDTEENLYLFNNSCELEDEVSANSDWPAGDKDNKKTMERGSDLTWHTYYGSVENGIYSTPKGQNSIIPVIPAGGGGGGGAILSSDLQNTPKILISEIQTASENSVKDEWIELYNPDSEQADISSWSVQKASESGTIYKKNFADGNIIPAQGYFLIANSQASNDILELADLTHASFDLADNNTIFLVKKQDKIKNGDDVDIVDKVGFGNAFSPEKNPAPNPEKGQSIERKNNQDTNDNSQDFVLQINPSPKGKTILKPDTTPPIVIFSPIAAIQNNSIFSLSWMTEDPIIGSISPSGLDGIYLQYTVSPSNIDGIRYQDCDSNWQKWIEGETLEINNSKNDLQISGKEGNIYGFKIKAIDRAGNESQWSEISTEIVVTQPVIEVVINEIAWMGTTNSSSDEWIELYNNTDSEIDLTGWVLKSSDETPNISLLGKISVKGFYLLERTNDDTLPSVSADQIYTGALGNNGEELNLYNSSNEIIDKVNCKKDGDGVCKEWFTGDNNSKSTMERKNTVLAGDSNDNWATSQNSGGTPKSQNSRYIP